MQSNISFRLNLDEKKMETENVHDILKELLHLINIKMH
jgi:hypothetical protein